MKIEKVILKNLLKNEEYTTKVLPFIKPEYFETDADRVTFKSIHTFISKYNRAPTYDALLVDIETRTDLSEETLKHIKKNIETLKADIEDTPIDWLVESTEKYCQERALHNAILKSIEIMDGKAKQGKGAIPTILSEALAITFDPHVGHDFFDDAIARHEYYHRKEERMPMNLEIMNKVLRGGVARKTLNIIMGGVHTGKTLFLCHFAADYLSRGKNVLYISMEMSEEEITKRIDTNLLNISFDDLEQLSKEMYLKRVESLRQKTDGRLIVKEYPSTTASVTHFKALLTELRLKKKFIPDVIMIDYINICASSRLSAGSAADTYIYVKTIAEEVRGFGQECGIPIWSATQLNRSGMASSDPEMTDVAESIGLPATCDALFALITSENLRRANQIMVKQVKNRYNNMDINKKFVLGVDKTKMKLYDIEESEQVDINDTGQIEEKKFSKFDKKPPMKKLIV